ncbi:transposase domain-containing protein [Pasteurella multocida]|uniref:transposase domain-containing protein n=1 Tax=Pasteurella multocida TaxID=747 RepID=UPI00202260E4|nr:transposase domain-containing protein [Pasteurella multocida]MCL7759262.1 Mu transposase C-terminal domain-containing protein [Pasteurella multocida]MCL7787748.1 Mu transposase C-terminal domain-containing protein [Pasteurella multocida]WNY74425.1 Mu transposase C-terminal domain-containing protein [Pasteurella multocida]HDR1289531.1 Mu transposase C-terminal domain-containing protein [Pasteurella multocida]HDR1335097.1 Mu transposase C-terminal domain-containing protein [Pasteurella multoc
MSNLKIKTHYSAMEIASFKLNSAPHAHKNVQEKAKRECWTARKREGRGGGLEYAFESLPQEIQAEILLKHTESKGFTEPTRGVAHKNYLPEVIWAPFDKASEKQRAEAQQKLILLHKIDDLTRNNIKLINALEMVANEFNVAKGSLKRWYYKVRTFERSDWLPLLIDKHGTNRKSAEAEFTPEAWESFKADYFRNERPQFGSCYERLKRSAREQGWVIPSASSVKRKIEREIPKVQQVFLRNGEHALSQYYPTMQRSVADLEALEWINGDGYQHNVFVQWHNGDIVRPKTWIWQDIRTRKILAYRVDLSENSDTIRLSLMDLIWKYGIPKKCTIDNTRAAANKWMTGGVKNRYRFKVKDDDVKGIIPLLGIELFWTSIQFGKGHGQAKPVERAFSHGGLGELVDKHPKLAGFYAGENIYNKPDNYNGGKAGVDYDTFILALEDGIRTFNEREGRETEICQGVYSFSQVFERDYAKARVRKASQEQMRILMLMSEATTLKKDGTFELDVGGKVHNRRNRYLCTDLIGSHHKKVIVKFDPQDLHSKVWVYSTEMIYLGEAECTERVAFGDKAAGREHDKARKQWVKAQKQAAKAQQTMNAHEIARFLPEPTFEEEIQQPQIIELFHTQGNAVKKTEVVLDDEENTFEQGLYRGLEMIKQEKGIK